MRKKIVAGNWKMNKTFAEGVELAREVNDYVRYKEGGEGVYVNIAISAVCVRDKKQTIRS